jgi:hypothetical protein
MVIEALPRQDPICALRFWWSVVAWGERHARGRPVAGALREADPRSLVGELLGCGCPRRLLSAKREDERHKRLRELARLIPPPHRDCFEVVANTAIRDWPRMYALIGMPKQAWDGGRDVRNEWLARAGADVDHFTDLWCAIRAVRSAAAQRAMRSARLVLPEAETRAFRRLAQLGDGWPFPLAAQEGKVQLIAIRTEPNPARPGVRGGPTAYPEDWVQTQLQVPWGDEDGPDDFRLSENWVVARAAAFLADFPSGVQDAWLFRCPRCEQFLVEPTRQGRPAKLCKPCGRYWHDYGWRRVDERDGKPCIEYCRDRLVLDLSHGGDFRGVRHVYVRPGSVHLSSDDTEEVPFTRVPR